MFIGGKVMDGFISVHNHSEYSNLRLLDSVNKIEAMIKYVANDLGQMGLALTDHDSLSGHIKFLSTVEDLKKKGSIPQNFKPILGNEIYLVDEQEVVKAMDNNEYTRFYHFILLARTSEGHQMLRQLSARAWRRARFHRGLERVNTYYTDIEEVIGNNKGHLIGSTACLGSKFAQLVLNLIQTEDEEEKVIIKKEIYQFLCWCLDTFGDDYFYIELQPSELDNVEQVEYNKMAIKIANAYQIPYIIATDSHYINKEQASIHEAFLTSQDDESGSREVKKFYEATYFHSEKEIREKMAYLGEEVLNVAIQNTQKIANSCEVYSLYQEQTIPVIPLPNEDDWHKDDELMALAKKHPNLYQMATSESQYDRYLVSLCFEGMRKKNVEPHEFEEYLSRLDLEAYEILGISQVRNEPISSYFVVMKKIIDLIWEAGSIVGPGRGSAGCFLINYLIDIVMMNPLRQGVELKHWRFLHHEKIELPKRYWALKVNPAKGCVA